MARGDARGTLCRRCTPSPLARYPFSPLTFNTFPGERASRQAGRRGRARTPTVPVASLGSTNFAKHRYKSFDNAHGPGHRYIQRGSRRQERRRGGRGAGEGWGGPLRVRVRRKREEKEGGSGGNLAIRQIHRRRRRRCEVRAPAPDQPVHRARRSANVSDDVADIANCKKLPPRNIARGIHTRLFNPRRTVRVAPLANSILSRVI